jgi:hypothetical protein
MRKPLPLSLVRGGLVALGLLAGSYLAIAQVTTLFSNILTGNETLTASIGGPQGTSFFVPVAQLRNATGYQLISAATSGTITPTNAVNSLLIAAQPSGSTTINTPPAPYDGQLFQVCNVSNAAFAVQTVTLAASTGSSLATGVTTALTTLAARTCEELQYTTTSTTWWQIR